MGNENRRFWDIFLAGRWIGMSCGTNLKEAKAVVKRCHPLTHRRIKYAEWFGRHDPRNCKTSGGLRPNPV